MIQAQGNTGEKKKKRIEENQGAGEMCFKKCVNSEICNGIDFSMYFGDEACYYYELLPKVLKTATLNCSTSKPLCGCLGLA